MAGTAMLMTQAMNFRKARTTNATDAAFPSRIPTATEPTGEGVIDLIGSPTPDGPVQNSVLLVPYATSGDNDTFSVRIIGWRRLRVAGSTDLWVPVVLAEIACTASATVGVAGTGVVATERFADTITLVTGNDDISIDIVSPTADEIAHVLLDLKGSQKLEISFDSTAVGTTDMNCLLTLL